MSKEPTKFGSGKNKKNKLKIHDTFGYSYWIQNAILGGDSDLFESIVHIRLGVLI